MNMRCKIIIGMLLVFAVTGIFSQEERAVIREFTGTVELRQVNSAAWVNARIGQTILPNTMISTGFKSTALIGIGDSLIAVRPLTRLSFTEIRRQTGTETINVGLQAGRVRADVKQPVGTRSSFSVQTPIATASTRGTVFEMDIYELKVIEGTVEYVSSYEARVLVDAGGYSFVDERTGLPAPPMVTMGAAISPDMPIANDIFNTFELGAEQIISYEVTAELTYK